jgi:hypothetical protein
MYREIRSSDIAGNDLCGLRREKVSSLKTPLGLYWKDYTRRDDTKKCSNASKYFIVIA